MPAFLSTLTKLTVFTMNVNAFTSTIPPGYSTLNQLSTLTLNSNPKLVGPIPASLSTLTMLTVLTLNGCTLLTGPIPAAYSTLTKLTSLNLASCALTGTLPVALSVLASVLSVTSNAALCGPTSAFPNLSTTGTNLGQTCPSPPRECKQVRGKKLITSLGIFSATTRVVGPSYVSIRSPHYVPLKVE